MIQLPNNLINEILSYSPDHRDNHSLVMKELNHINTWCKLCYKIKYNNKKNLFKNKNHYERRRSVNINYIIPIRKFFKRCNNIYYIFFQKNLNNHKIILFHL